MDNQKKISDKDLKLLIYFCSFLLLAAAFFLGYMKMNEKRNNLESKIPNLTAKLATLRSKSAKKDMYDSEMKSMSKEIQNFESEYPYSTTLEGNIMFLTNMEKDTKTTITNINFLNKEVIYPVSNTGTLESNEGGAGISSNEEGIVNEVNSNTDNKDLEESKKSQEDSKKISDSASSEINKESLIGYKTAVQIDFSTTYKGLKACINYINNADSKMNINDMSVAYDSSTGNLTGNMTINMYTMSGTSKVNEPVIIDGIDIGTDNIFGTFEAPNN